MEVRSAFWYTGAIAGLALVSACGVPEQPPAVMKFEARLRADNEVPDTVSDKSAAAIATFEISGTSIRYTLEITTAPKAGITVAHIHQGAAGVSGPVRVNLCGTGAPAPACPTGAGTVSGTASTVAGISFDSLVTLMRNYQTYANVHTTAQPGGVMRGQLIGRP